MHLAPDHRSGCLLFGDKTGKYADPLGITKTAVGDPTGRVRRARKEAEDERRTYASSGVSSVAYRSAAPAATALGGTAPRNTVLGGG
ncbi:hypothetical protein C7E17_00280 [Stenotrophomonas maltophilia]|nr:hypothetical protein C7E17_00280 [Stenotrophomonas maltophilia]